MVRHPVVGPDREWADKLNSLPKYVVSSTLKEPKWSNSTVLNGDLVKEVSKLKQEIDGDILVYASYQLVRTLIEHDLVDEFRLVIFPVVLGAASASSATPVTRHRCASSAPRPSVKAYRCSPTRWSDPHRHPIGQRCVCEAAEVASHTARPFAWIDLKRRWRLAPPLAHVSAVLLALTPVRLGGPSSSVAGAAGFARTTIGRSSGVQSRILDWLVGAPEGIVEPFQVSRAKTSGLHFVDLLRTVEPGHDPELPYGRFRRLEGRYAWP